MKAILFVDDHEVLARLSCQILRSQGYRASYAYNAQEALAKFDAEPFDMLVTDYRMEEMDGLELARRIRLKAPGLPVIIVSGYVPEESAGTAVDAWLDKQDLFPALLDKVKTLLDDSGAEPVRQRA